MRTVPYPEMTDAMMDAGQRYLDSKSIRPEGFSLPGTFNWHEFWRAIIDAAPEQARPYHVAFPGERPAETDAEIHAKATEPSP